VAQNPAPSPPAQPADPFKVKFIYGGQYSHKQVSQYADYSGLIFSYTNTGTGCCAR
jgi:hypothetical protein